MDVGNSLTRSVSTCSNGTVIGRDQRCWDWLVWKVHWHGEHHWQKFSISTTIPGQWNQFQNFSKVFCGPRYPPSRWAWARYITVSTFVWGTTKKNHRVQWGCFCGAVVVLYYSDGRCVSPVPPVLSLGQPLGSPSRIPGLHLPVPFAKPYVLWLKFPIHQMPLGLCTHHVKH